MINIGIKETVKKALIEIFKKYKSVEKVLLFGSRARGNFKKTSDIDLAVFSKDISSKDFNLLIDEINQINTAHSFDVVHYEKTYKEALKNSIKRDGVVLYER